MRISDWSSDVCSSDLRGAGLTIPGDVPTSLIEAASFRMEKMAMDIRVSGHQVDVGDALKQQCRDRLQGIAGKYFSRAIAAQVHFGRGPHEIGRASGRERVCQYV